ncbi:uncharacterized protein LAESUDRAFT_474482 [Laetiporus sulphureus 93-53]|uniref:Uncharacterized protein n=1 Tax=Laetiporus sulphureus 93-53 TaxID=1314785 RepID=A0A165GCP1_9APHY|nr:uncharacterized protein LAESUDRAFT_474482 [Laetiporus sulphureus 93-53]KZT10165.1 hypothetical protein LAESUDRAFT_474482 [Laetiporus sulphureus 93-53]
MRSLNNYSIRQENLYRAHLQRRRPALIALTSQVRAHRREWRPQTICRLHMTLFSSCCTRHIYRFQENEYTSMLYTFILYGERKTTRATRRRG